jgi:hypothetical protein
VLSRPPFDQLLGSLCDRFAHQADALLDLRNSAIHRTKPGLCVSCYFKLFGHADENAMSLLCPLRSWIETNIEVIATDHRERIIEQLPVKLDAPDLDAYCQEVIHEFRENRVYSTPNLTLEFRYKEAA